MKKKQPIPEQLTLKIQPVETYDFSNFYSGDNQELITVLKNLIEAPNEKFIYLWGQSGSGLTHLLQACCQTAFAQQQTAMYINLNEVGLKPDILQSVENLSLICIDNLDVIMGKVIWEEALFHFYNRARENNIRLVMAAHESPLHLSSQLKDLKSRLSWGLIFHVLSLSDEQKILALQMRAQHLGINLNQEVAKFLLTHFSRHPTDLFNSLNQIEQKSLATKRRITIPFLKEILL